MHLPQLPTLSARPVARFIQVPSFTLPVLPKPAGTARPVAPFIPVPSFTLPVLPKPAGTDLSVQRKRTISDDRALSNGEVVDGQVPVSFEGASVVDTDASAVRPNKRRRMASRLSSSQAVLMIERFWRMRACDNPSSVARVFSKHCYRRKSNLRVCSALIDGNSRSSLRGACGDSKFDQVC
jgi:hypothetical protein